jgi:membrane fusion protein (multidrug efflux system)
MNSSSNVADAPRLEPRAVPPADPLEKSAGRPDPAPPAHGQTPTAKDSQPNASEAKDSRSADAPPTEDAAPGNGHKRRFIVLLVLAALLAIGLIFGVPWYLHARNFESTDDAFIEGHVIRIDPKVAAYVTAVHFDDNYQVKQGDLLLELDPRDFDLALNRAQTQLAQSQAEVLKAQAGVEQAQAQLAQAQAQVEQQTAQVTQSGAQFALAQINFNRNNSLYSKDMKAISKEQVDTTKANFDAAQGSFDSAKAFLTAAKANLDAVRAAGDSAGAQLVAAQADVRTAEVAVRDANLQLSYTKIYAPSAGRVTQKAVEPGDYVTVDQTLLSLVPPVVWVTANFKETQLTHMKAGQPVDIHVDPFPNRRFTGRVDSIQRGTGSRFSLLPPENATGNYVKVVQRVPVKITFTTDGGDLPMLGPGMSVEPEVDVSSGR